MKTEEMIELQIAGSPTTFIAMQEIKMNDTSFTETNFWGLPIKYSQSEVRDIYFNAIEAGIQRGLQLASLEGQRIELYNNIKDERQKEFLDSFYDLVNRYHCGIQYHPMVGMCVIDLGETNPSKPSNAEK